MPMNSVLRVKMRRNPKRSERVRDGGSVAEKQSQVQGKEEGRSGILKPL